MNIEELTRVRKEDMDNLHKIMKGLEPEFQIKALTVKQLGTIADTLSVIALELQKMNGKLDPEWMRNRL